MGETEIDFAFALFRYGYEYNREIVLFYPPITFVSLQSNCMCHRTDCQNCLNSRTYAKSNPQYGYFGGRSIVSSGVEDEVSGWVPTLVPPCTCAPDKRACWCKDTDFILPDLRLC